MSKNMMLKYGCLEDDVRFELDGWALVAPVAGEGLDCVHGCHRKDKLGIPIQWSYTIPGNPNCPGCDAVMPDEIQGLFQLANMDAARASFNWIEREIGIAVAKVYAEFEKKLLTGCGVDVKAKLTEET